MLPQRSDFVIIMQSIAIKLLPRGRWAPATHRGASAHMTHNLEATMNRTYLPKTPLALAIAALALSAGAARSQEAPASGDGTPSAASKNADAQAEVGPGLNMQSVVVTGTSERKLKMRTPYAISTIDKESIQEKAPRSTVDLLKSVPGINVENSGGEGGGENVVIRGLPFSGFRLLDLLEDGLPLFESNFERQLQIDELYRVDLNTDRVELVRGGTAPIFSNNASGGVVNFITNHGTSTPHREIKVSAGSHALLRTDFEASGPTSNDDLEYSIGGFYRQSNGERNPGFDHGNQGGQIKLGGTYFLRDGSVFADFKHLDDRSIFYSDIPLSDQRNGNSLAGLINPSTGTLTSSKFANVSFPVGNGAGGAQTVDRDLNNGIHPEVNTTTFGGDFELGSGWTFADKLRDSRGTVGFDAILNGAPTDAQANLSSQLAGAQTAITGTASLRYVLAGTSTPFNPASTAGLVMTNTWSSTRTKFSFDVNDARLNKVIRNANGGRHEMTVGLSFSHFSLNQQQIGNTLLTNVQNQPSALDIQAIDAQGNVIGALTQNGFTTYGSGDLIGNVSGHAVAPYATENWFITNDWQVDVGVRHETRFEDGNRGVIGTIQANTTGPVAARKITGLTGYIPYTKTLHGTSWTLGSSLQFNSTTNGFVRYSSAYSLPRLSDQWANINNGVAGTLPNGSPVPVTPIKQAETGIKISLPTLQVALIGFWSHFDKLNSSTYVANASGVLSNQPLILNTTTKGIELEAAWQPVKMFDLNSSLTLQSPKIESAETFNTTYTSGLAGKTIPRVPSYMVTLQPGVTFDAIDIPARAYATVNSLGRRYQDFVNTSILPAYTTLDIGLTLRFNKNLRMDVFATNLTNSRGLTEGNARAPAGNSLVASDATVGRPIFGRAFVASLDAKW